MSSPIPRSLDGVIRSTSGTNVPDSGRLEVADIGVANPTNPQEILPRMRRPDFA
jgi:hypothetical protein